MNSFKHIGDFLDAERAWGVSGGGEIIHSLTQTGKLFIFSYAPSHRSLIAWSDNTQEILGAPDASLTRDANVFLRHVHPDDRFRVLSQLEPALKGESHYSITYRWLRPDTNELRWLHCRAKLVASSAKQPIKESGSQTTTSGAAPITPTWSLFEGFILDISPDSLEMVTSPHGAENTAALLSAFPGLMILFDQDLRISQINTPNSSIPEFHFGDSGFHVDTMTVGRLFLDCFENEAQRNLMRQALQSILNEQQPSFSMRIPEPPGVVTASAVYQVQFVALRHQESIHGAVAFISDVSAVVDLEKSVAELQKSEGLRVLAGGVAHHFNNALQAIVGHASVMSAHRDNPDIVTRTSQAIIDLVSKTSELTKQLSSLEHKQHDQASEIDLNLVVMNAVNAIDDLFAEGVKVAVAFGSLSMVHARQGELTSEFESLFRHIAREALPVGTKSCTLSVKTFEETLSSREGLPLSPGRYAKILIGDRQGVLSREGLLQALRDNRFALTIERLGGCAVVEAGVGKAFQLAIYLPVTQESAVPVDPLHDTEDQTAPEILVVDDDAMVLTTVSTLLHNAGFACEISEIPERAIDIVRKSKDSLRLILMDALMPGMDGATLLKRIKKIAPHITVIGFSGASVEATQPMLDAGAKQILNKPVSPTTLLQVVRGVVGSTQEAA